MNEHITTVLYGDCFLLYFSFGMNLLLVVNNCLFVFPRSTRYFIVEHEQFVTSLYNLWKYVYDRRMKRANKKKKR